MTSLQRGELRHSFRMTLGKMQSRPASDLSFQQLATLFNDAFTGYIGGSFNFSAEALEKWIPNNCISLARSHVFYHAPEAANNDEYVAFAFIALRHDKPNHARLAVMGLRARLKARCRE